MRCFTQIIAEICFCLLSTSFKPICKCFCHFIANNSLINFCLLLLQVSDFEHNFYETGDPLTLHPCPSSKWVCAAGFLLVLREAYRVGERERGVSAFKWGWIGARCCTKKLWKANYVFTIVETREVSFCWDIFLYSKFYPSAAATAAQHSLSLCGTFW
jgi:hypothetical protein